MDKEKYFINVVYWDSKNEEYSFHKEEYDTFEEAKKAFDGFNVNWKCRSVHLVIEKKYEG